MPNLSYPEAKIVKRHTTLPWLIWGVAALFYAYEFFLQVSPSVMVPDLMFTFDVNAASLGNLAAIYFYIYAIMQVPAGVFLDVLGPRKLLTIASAICLAGAFIFGAATGLWEAQLGRLLIGFGSAFAAIGTLKLGTSWFPANRFAFITGLTVMIGMLGAVTAGAPLALLVAHVGWRNSMLTLGFIGLIICVLIFLIVRDKPHDEPEDTDTHSETLEQGKLIPSLFYIFKQKQSWLVALYGGFMFGPTSAFAALWGVSFVMTKYHMHRAPAAAIVSMIFIGWAVGSPLAGWIADYCGLRKPTMYVGAILALLLMLVILYVKLPTDLLYFVFFGFGLFSAGFIPAFSIIREINPPQTNATALGFMNMLNMVAGAILQPLIGMLLDLYWQGTIIKDNVRLFSLHAYNISLMILPIILALALLILPFIKETYCKQCPKTKNEQ